MHNIHSTASTGSANVTLPLHEAQAPAGEQTAAEPASTSAAPPQPRRETSSGKAMIRALMSDHAKKLFEAAQVALSKPLTPDDLRPGDIMITFEEVPTSDSHAFMQKLQNTRNLNGIPLADNAGDYRNVHGLIATKNPNNPGSTMVRGPGEPQVVEGRGGLGTTNIMRLQGSAIPAGTFKVFRPKDAHLADIAAQISMCWANEGNVFYSLGELSNMGKEGDIGKKLTEFGDDAKKRAMAYFKSAFDSKPECFANPEGELVPRKDINGTICSTLPGKAYQAAFLQIAMAMAKEKGENVTLMEMVDKLPGWLAHNQVAISPKTLEHLLLNDSDSVEPIGTLTMQPENVLYQEERFPPRPTDPVYDPVAPGQEGLHAEATERKHMHAEDLLSQKMNAVNVQ